MHVGHAFRPALVLHVAAVAQPTAEQPGMDVVVWGRLRVQKQPAVRPNAIQKLC